MFFVLDEEPIHSKHEWLYVLPLLAPFFFKSRIPVSTGMNILKSCQAPSKVTHKLFCNSIQILQIIVHSPLLGPAESSRPLHPKLNNKFNSPFHFVNADICTYFCTILITSLRYRSRHGVMYIAELSSKKVAKI